MSERKSTIFDLIHFVFLTIGMLAIFVMVFSLTLFAQNAYALNTTESVSVRVSPGSATLTGNPELNVSASYADDDNSSNRILIEWGESGVDFSLGSQLSGLHPSSPYSYTITPLDNSKTYQIRVTYQDTDNGSNPQKVVTGRKPYNPMLHNAVTTGSGTSKWVSGWGTSDAGSEYGEFTCQVCHNRKSGNIKRIRKDWTDASVPDVPIKTDGTGETVDFNDSQNGTAQFADNDTIDHNTADRICEACHTRTSYHQHDMASTTADHNSTKNCQLCHSHSQGFKPVGCDSCHGGGTVGSVESNIWPDSADETVDVLGSQNDSGEHLAHINALSEKLYGATSTELLDRPTSLKDQQALCLYCHAVNDDDHADADDDDAEVFVTDIAGVPTTFAKSMWNATDNAAAYAVGGSSCSTLDCHNDNSVSVSWYGGTSSSCTLCHTTGGTVNPTSGLHNVTPDVTGQKHDSSISGGCAACHTTLMAQSTHMDGTAQAGNGQSTQMGLAGFYTQTADNTGTCASTSCHFASGGSSDDWNHLWDSTAGFYTDNTTACAGCHGDWSNGWNAGITHRTTIGANAKHGTGTNYDCKDCHNLEAASGYTFTNDSEDWSPAAGETSTHGDGQIQVNTTGTSYNTTTGFCEGCHTVGTYNFSDTGWAIASVSGDAITTTCGECHQGGVSPGNVTESHSAHGISDADLVVGGAKCVVCHGDNGGSNFQNTYSNGHGNDNIELLGTRITTYTGGLTKWDADESTCTNSCHATDANPAWDAANTLACDQCHYYEGTPTSANNSGAGALADSHNSHFNAATITACTQCHPDNSGESAPHAHIDGTTLLEKSREGIIADNADMTPLGADFDDGANTCDNAACHNPSGGSYVSAAWGVSNASCQMCHSNSDPGTESHTVHMDAATNFGINVNCDSCHPTASGRDHMDGTKQVEVAKNSSTATIADATALNGCGTNDCHNNGTSLTTGTPADYTWGTPITDCTECHGNATTQISNAHNEHMGYAGANCTDCHTAADVSTHIDKSVNLDGTKATFSLGATVAVGTTPNGSCATTSCHNQTGGDSIAWNVGTGDVAGTTALTCDSCHYFDAPATAAANTSHFASLSASHGDHFTAGKVCTQCHGALPTTTAHIDNKTSLIDGAVALQDEAGMNWSHASAYTDYTLAADNSCGSATNSGLGCHATGTPDWDTTFDSGTCDECHTDNATAEVNPTSGLHGVTPSVSGQQHDDTVAGGCAACHTSMPVFSSHKNGTFTGNGSVAGDRTSMSLAGFYTSSGSDNSGTCANTNCHYEVNGGTNGSSDDWTHVWNSTANFYTTQATACAGCHGDWLNNWNTGVTHRTTDLTLQLHGGATDGVACGQCHVIAANANYNFTFSTADWDQGAETSHHGNGTIEINSKASYLKDTTKLCSTCHSTVDSKHDFVDTAWNVNAALVGDDISASCSSCHGGGMSGTTEKNFWPDDSDETAESAATGNNSGEHVIHMTHLALQDGMTLQELVDDGNSKLLQVGYCERCHGANAGSAAYHFQGDDVGDLGNFADMDGSADSLGVAGSYNSGTCSNIDCHNNINTPSPNWYGGVNNAPCTMCHTVGPVGYPVKTNPSSGLHYSATPNGAELHDDSFTGGGGCLSCHTTNPTDNHVDGTVQTTAQTTFNFLSNASVDVKLNDVADPTDDTCASSCHSDNKNWYRFWSVDAFDGTAFDTSTGAAITTTIQSAMPVRCRVCHGDFGTTWAEGTSHYNMDVDNTSSGASHNSQNPNINPGAGCVDCHLYPDHLNPGDGATRHDNGLITLTDDQTAPDDYTPYDDDETAESRIGVYCSDCHEANAVTRDGFNANTFEYSTAFPGWAKVEIVATNRNPEYTCFSGANGCHGDTTNNWWPNVDSSDPIFYPNREGAHFEHGTTIGELLADQMNQAFPGSRIDADGDGHVDAVQEDRNKTCNFCHPMAWNSARGVWESLYHRANTPEAGAVVTDVFGGYTFPGADKKGVYISGDPTFGGDSWLDIDTDGSTGFAYQLEPDPLNPGQDPRYPLDHDGTYYQYLDGYKVDSSVRHGVCSNVACHSNTPFTPQWYGDEQPPGQITDLTAYTNSQDPDSLAGSPDATNSTEHDTIMWDAPGTVQLYWTAPGDNGDFDGLAYEYEVYYSTSAAIDDDNLGSATRAGGATSVLRKGEQQLMVVDGLTPGANYWFAVVTKDQPVYLDDDHDDVYDLFVRDGKRSMVGATVSSTPAHPDDRPPVFWGTNVAVSHDTGGAINLSWDSARDHTLPLTYLVYWTDHSLKTHLSKGGTMPSFAKDGGIYSQGYTDGTPPTEGGSDYFIEGSSTTGMNYQVTGLGTGILYNLLVRSEDGAGNVDDNSVVSMAMANIMNKELTETKMALLSGPNSMIDADPLNPVWGSAGSITLNNGNSVTFTAVAELDGVASRDYWVQGLSFDVMVNNAARRDPQAFDVELGYDNGSFQTLGTMSATIGRRATRVMKLGFSSVTGLVPANANMAIRITSRGSVDTLTFSWGDNTDKGQLLYTAQPINHEPSAPSFGSLSRGTGGYVDITWSPSSDNDGGSQSIHYDLFGSADNGGSYPYIIGTNLTDADASAGVRWDTVGDGLDMFHAGGYNAMVKIDVSDGYLYETTPGSGTWFSHRTVESGTIDLNNSQDDEAPAAVTINHIEPRPKQGSAYLHWIAVGNDGYNHGTRAAYYDIRFRRAADGSLSANWTDPATTEVQGEPVPGFSGSAEEFEMLNMAPDTAYEVAIVTCDSGEDDTPTGDGSGDDNCSGLSNVYTLTSGQYYCGICHSTPPDEPDTKGIHREHGYTLEDCAKCHGDGTGPDDGIGLPGNNNVLNYDGRHYDGVINIGWAKDTAGDHLMMAQIAPTETSGVSIDQGSGVIYSDPDGSGGFNSNGAYTATVNTDSGRCMNFIGANANGCHGPFSPQWAPDTGEPNPAAPECSDCHGDKSAARDLDPYDRTWDCNDAGAPSELVKASPPQANHGGTADTDRYVGAHEKHLNSSFRFAKGDSCRLCHRDTMDLGLHADGNVDVIFDVAADFDEATPATVDQTHGTVDTIGASCGSMNNMSCHDSGANWAEPGAQCNGCHGMSAKTYNEGDGSSQIGHVMGQAGVVEACTYCHVAGHPQSPDGIIPGDPDTLLINNNAAIGINYKSGGIHLKRVYPWGTFTTLAEICWGCHDQNNDGDLNDAGDISEWSTNSSVATGSSSYNFGTLSQKSWTGATWTSGHPTEFAYKTGLIQSTHTTDPTGTSEVTFNPTYGRYEETIDPISKIRCSNCHDVHDSNFADGDTMTGRPYLRGSWLANPYEEDGAPWSGRSYTEPTDGAMDYTFGDVPRGGADYDELGGFYIDQNNVVPGTGLNANPTPARYPTSGQTIASSAGLCVLCHSDNVDEMDQRKPSDDAKEGALWLGTNGHSNSVLGGSADPTKTTNVFDYTHGRPSPVSYTTWTKPKPADTNHRPVLVADMALGKQGDDALAGGGYRGTDSNAGGYDPPTSSGQPYAYGTYDWGASVDAGTTDGMYHQFSCSKCHNPHASRLPKLMITNCLDIRHNEWDDNFANQTAFTASALTAVDRNMPTSYFASAQNCHRYDGRRSNTTLRGGWNKVTPWTHRNDNNAQHGNDEPSENYTGGRSSN